MIQEKLIEYAEFLKNEQIKFGIIDQSFIKSVSNKRIIDLYSTCPHCGERFYTVEFQNHVLMEFETLPRAFEIFAKITYQHTLLMHPETLSENTED